MNMICRYNKVKDRFGNSCPMQPLDEIQENVNIWKRKYFLVQMKLTRLDITYNQYYKIVVNMAHTEIIITCQLL